MTEQEQWANWDLSSYFPEFNGPEYVQHIKALEKNLDTMESMAKELGTITLDNQEKWVELFLVDEKILAEFSHIASYVGCLCAADVANEAYLQAEAFLSRLGALATKSFAPVMAALGKVDDESFSALVACEELAGAKYFIERLRVDAARRMEPEMEVLAADLGVDGISAWGRLYDAMSGRLEFPMPNETGEETLVPMAQKRMFLEDQDATVRKNALENSNKSWEQVEYVASAALNSIAGTRLTLNRYRGIEDFMEVPLFQSAIEQQTLDTMWDVVAENRELALRYLKKKASCLGVDKLGFQDLNCPLPFGGTARYTWDEGKNLVLDAFGAVYPELATFTQSMFDTKRVESEKRSGKRPGAFCTTSLLSRESRVFMSYGGGLGDVQTLAHELGHAFHGSMLKSLRPMASRYPMTLAETASTFAERLLQNAILDDEATDATQKLNVLTARLNDAATFMCDIRMRYLFEKALYTERAQGELGVGRIKELMLDAQKECYGDVLNPDEMDPMFWASKLHFYITGVSFYNFPYTFGFLLSLSLSAGVREQGADYLPKYETFLKLTGSDTAEGAVRQALGMDMGQKEFWEKGMASIKDDVEAFEALLQERDDA